MNTEQALIEAIGLTINIDQLIINGYQINYATVGNGPPMLLIHGANFGWGVWYPNISAFAKKFTLYLIDLPGAGRSTRLDYKKLDPEKDLYAIVNQFIKILNLHDLVVLGCSIGGWLAFRIALENPDRVQKLIIENSVGFADYMNFNDKIIGFYPLAKLISMTILKPKRSNKNIEKFLRGIFYNKELELKPEFIDYFYETMSTSHNLLFISRLITLNSEFLLQEKLKNIFQPTLIIWGRQDRIIPLEKNYRNFQLLPHQTTQVINHAGHIPSLEEPSEFNKTVLAFLR